MLRAKGNYKRNQNQKLLQEIISEETKNCNKNLRHQIAGEQWLLDEQCLQEKHSCNTPFSSIFRYSFLWSLICNVEFNSNSSCLDRLNNFGIICDAPNSAQGVK